MGPDKKKGKQKVDTGDESQQANPILQDYIPEPIATLKFDFQNVTENYKGCVEEIIKAMKDDPAGPNFSFLDKDGKEKLCVPVTPGKENTPSGVYTIALDDDKGTRLLLVAEKYQTWFRGIVTKDGKRYEIQGFKPKIMAGSTPLHTSARYYDLLKKTVGECTVGYNPLINSFYNLAGHNAENDKYGVAIAVLLVMLFEAARFPAVFKWCLKLLEKMDEGMVGDVLQELINDWSDISSKFYDENGEEREIRLADQELEPIKKVATGVTILCRSRWDEFLEKKKKTEPKSSACKWQPGSKSKKGPGECSSKK